MSDTDKLITLDRLKDLLAAYGARPDLWPAVERAAAQALIDSSDQASALYAEEQALDALLRQVAEPEVSAALHGRVRSIALPPAPAPSASLPARMLEWLRPQSQMAWQGAVVAAGILGIVAGVGISAVVFDAALPAKNTILAASDGADGTTNTSNAIFSLTGEIISETETVADETVTDETDNGDGTFTVAGIPLY
ncbi:MAG: hypothetical protein HOK82_03575 [Rhodospirillaceae bacterium]|jgi:hypothetical protein|nr:hypothetical protein [Rhodospirillaceae bacterium]